MSSYIALNYWELAAASVFVFIDAGLSVLLGLKVHRDLLVAAIRMTVQLALVGLVLAALFSVVSPLWTGIAAFVMVLFAGHEAAQRQERRLSGWWSYGLGTGCMMMSSVLVTVFALSEPEQWAFCRWFIGVPPIAELPPPNTKRLVVRRSGRTGGAEWQGSLWRKPAVATSSRKKEFLSWQRAFRRKDFRVCQLPAANGAAERLHFVSSASEPLARPPTPVGDPVRRGRLLCLYLSLLLPIGCAAHLWEAQPSLK